MSATTPSTCRTFSVRPRTSRSRCCSTSPRRISSCRPRRKPRSRTRSRATSSRPSIPIPAPTTPSRASAASITTRNRPTRPTSAPPSSSRRISAPEEEREPMPHAIRFHKTGGPDVLQWDEVQVGKPGQGEARVRHTAVGLNYVETYFRSGLYPAPLPSSLGTEAAGVVEEVGPGVSDVKAGDRVAYVGGPLGAYSEVRVMPAERLVVLPKGISDQQGAAMMLKGLTTQYLIRQIFKVKKGDTILFHAAAGGVGLIACQWAKALGATVIGTVGSDEKAKLAKSHGCEHVIIYTREDFVERVKELTKGEKVPVVYDSVGKDTFMKSLDCIRPH